MRTVELLQDVYDGELKVTSPLISEKQIGEVIEISEDLGLETRITGLVPPPGMERSKKCRVASDQCSLGGEECNYSDKRLVLPSFEVVHCAVEKLGFDCPEREEAKRDERWTSTPSFALSTVLTVAGM